MTGSRAHPEVSRIFASRGPTKRAPVVSLPGRPALTHALAHLDSTARLLYRYGRSQSGTRKFQLSPVPALLNGELMSSRTLYVDGEYLAKNPAWHAEESAWKALQVLRMLRQNQISPKSVCDAGCGAGEVLKQLQEKLDKECGFWGYDISPQAIDLAKTRASEKIHFELGEPGQDSEKVF